MLVKTLLPFIIAALAANAAPLATAEKAPSKGPGHAPERASGPAVAVVLPVGPRAEAYKAGKQAEGPKSPLPVGAAEKLAEAKSHVPRDAEGEVEAAKPKHKETKHKETKPKHKESNEAPFPVSMLPPPAKQVVNMASRAEGRVTSLKESQPDFRPTTHTTDAKSKKVSQTTSTMKVYNVGHEKGTEVVKPLGVHVRDASKHKESTGPVNAFPDPEKVTKIIPRASKPAKKPAQEKAAMPQVPPAQVMEVKDTAFSHVPRAPKKNSKQTAPPSPSPASPLAPASNFVAEKSKMVPGQM